MLIRRITIIRRNFGPERDVNKSLQDISRSLGLFGSRDKEKSCFRIFIVLLKASKKGVALSSDEIAYLSNLSRGTVVHHLNKLLDAGIVVSYKNKYKLIEDNIHMIIKNIKRDVDDYLDDLMILAREIDNLMKEGY